MATEANPVYEPEGPASEALSSWYVRNLVQRTIDQAFKLAPPPTGRADGGPAESRTGQDGLRGESTRPLSSSLTGIRPGSGV